MLFGSITEHEGYIAMSMLEKIRAKQQGSEPMPAPAAKPAPPRDKKRKDHAPPAPVVKHCCGHFRKLTEVANSACPACQRAHRRAKHERNMENRKARAQETDPTAWRHEACRLPHGSVKTLAYDGEQQRWEGTLSIPGLPAFTASASSEKKTCHDLHDAWQRHVQEGQK